MILTHRFSSMALERGVRYSASNFKKRQYHGKFLGNTAASAASKKPAVSIIGSSPLQGPSSNVILMVVIRWGTPAR